MVVAGACGGQQAARSEPARGFYLNGSLGIALLDQEEGKEPEANAGVHLGTTCGYRFNRLFALELDSGFIRNTFADDRDSPELPLSQIPVVFNAVFHLANASRLEPYVGAGFGVNLIWNEEVAGGDATLAFKAGVRHIINDRMAIGADYTYYMLGFLSAFIGESVGDDTLNLGVRWSF